MGSMLKFDSDRRELVRERRQARMERKTLRREDRERKRTTTAPIATASTTSTLSATQRAADERVRDDVDRIVEQALDRHDQRATTVGSTVARPADRTDRTDRTDRAGHRGAEALRYGLGRSGASPPHRARRQRDRGTPTSSSRSVAEPRTGSGGCRVASVT